MTNHALMCPYTRAICLGGKCFRWYPCAMDRLRAMTEAGNRIDIREWEDKLAGKGER